MVAHSVTETHPAYLTSTLTALTISNSPPWNWRCWGLDEGEVVVARGRMLQMVSEMEDGLRNVIRGIWKQVVP